MASGISVKILLDILTKTNSVDFGGYLPWYDGAARVGWMRPELASELSGPSDPFIMEHGVVFTRKGEADAGQRSAQINATIAACTGKPGFGRWNNEFSNIHDINGDYRLTLARCASVPFGYRTFGSHVCGYTAPSKDTAEKRMWVGVRGATGDGFAGQLDTLAGGFIGTARTPLEVAREEAAEEAGIGSDLAANLQYVGVVRGRREFEHGIAPYGVYCFDLEIPEAYVPSPRDDEVSEFVQMDAAELVAAMADGRFKFNNIPIIIDWLIRHGLVEGAGFEIFELSVELQRWDPKGVTDVSCG